MSSPHFSFSRHAHSHADRGQRLSAEERQAQIVRVASELFAEKGFRGTTTREIAHECGISEATIFRHFATKDELYDAIIRTYIQAQEDIGLGADFENGSDDQSAFEAFAIKFLQYHTSETAFWRLVVFSGLENHDLAARFFKQHVQQGLNKMADRIRERQTAGAFRDDLDAYAAAFNFLGMIVHHANTVNVYHRRQNIAPDLPLEETGRQIATLFIAGMRNPNNA